MTKQEIEKLSGDWADNFDTSDPTFAKIKRQTAEISYRKGAEMVNEKQPYSADDMTDFAEWSSNHQHLLWDNGKYLRYAECLRIWEESKNGK